ncbi:hypothetical protein F4818DRAFT_440425 [Hypoxylon cercidicola]|nr:hypothetical protein F4818DRAFT_440425 [Hypoxylon cercidicola]
MPAPTNKTNFKTYEASMRLLAAVIATNQGKIKLDFKAIATHMGGGTGRDAVNHRLRPIKALAKMMSQCVAEGKDPGDLKLPVKGGEKGGELASLMGGGTTASAVDHRLRPVKQLSKLQLAVRQQGKDPGDLPVDAPEIQKLFGESTAGGIEWQFRDIKALGKEQQEAVADGKDPSKLKPAGLGTPSRAKARAKKSQPTSGTKRKRGSGGPIAKRKVAMSDEEDEEELGSMDFDAKDVHSDEKDEGYGNGNEDDDSDVQITPTPTPASKRTRLPSRAPQQPSSAAASPAAKKSGAGTSGVRRSLFGNGARPVVDDDEIQIVDLSEEPPARKMPSRTSRFKADPEPQPADEMEADLSSDPFMGSASMYGDADEYVDGEA